MIFKTWSVFGSCLKEVQLHLAQLVILNGMETNPNKPGVEKLVACECQRAWLQSDPGSLKSSEVLGEKTSMLSPNRTFMVKGWNRSICLMTVLYAAYTSPELLEAGLVAINSNHFLGDPSWLHPWLLSICEAIPAEVKAYLGKNGCFSLLVWNISQ